MERTRCSGREDLPQSGQSYDSVNRNLLLSYKESERGQILHEVISEASTIGSVIAVGTSTPRMASR